MKTKGWTYFLVMILVLCVLRVGLAQAGTEAPNVTLFGDGAGLSNTGAFVTFIGDSAGPSNSADDNTFVGDQAGLSNKSLRFLRRPCRSSALSMKFSWRN